MMKKWNLVTGDKKEIYSMAKIYLAVKWVNRGCMIWFTENLVLVDTKREFEVL
jgi:protein SCO1/2